MSNLFTPPVDRNATIWSSLPNEFRITGETSSWAEANKPGHQVDSFLEGPSFDRDGNLWLVDIPWGRIFKVSPDGAWQLVTRYDGWPNGLKIHRDGRVFIADYRRGILVLDPESGAMETLLHHRYSESFRGCNDLFFASNGDLYFTDQGQSGLHQPDGRVFRYSVDGRLECLVNNCPSPNGLVMNLRESVLYVAMTRDNAVWRLPIMADGGVSKVGRFVQLSGGLSGPDGMALDSDGALLIAHAGLGTVWMFTELGEPAYRVRCPGGLTTTNIAFGGAERQGLYITDSDKGHVLHVQLSAPGKPMYSHQ
jgi:gluconolactonase